MSAGAKIAATCVALSFGVILAGFVILGAASSVSDATTGMVLAIVGCVGVLCSMHAWTYLDGA